MNILLLTNYFPPEIGAASHLFFELAEGLVKKGYGVSVLTGFPRYNALKVDAKYKGKTIMSEDLQGIRIFRVSMPSFPKNIPFLRGFEHFIIAGMLFIRGLFFARPDVMLVYSPPLTLGLTAYFLRVIKKAPFILNVQDLFPQSVVDLGMLKSKLLIRIFERIEKFIYKKADYITVHSEGNRRHVLSKGCFPEKAITIHNWVDIHSIKPADRKNGFSNKYGLDGKFIVSFAGTMGYSQDMEVIVGAAKILKDKEGIFFILVGDGVELEGTKEMVRKYSLNNVKFLPMQSRQHYPLVLGSSAISLVSLKKSVVSPTVPSKILSIMAAQRPVIASMHLAGDAPRIIKEAKCGLVTAAEDAKGMAEAIEQLYLDKQLREEMGRNGRKFVERYFSLESALVSYEKIFNDLA